MSHPLLGVETGGVWLWDAATAVVFGGGAEAAESSTSDAEGSSSSRGPSGN